MIVNVFPALLIMFVLCAKMGLTCTIAIGMIHMFIALIVPLTVFAIQHTAVLVSPIITNIKILMVTIVVLIVSPIVYNVLIVQVVQNAKMTCTCSKGVLRMLIAIIVPLTVFAIQHTAVLVSPLITNI